LVSEQINVGLKEVQQDTDKDAKTEFALKRVSDAMFKWVNYHILLQ